MEALPACLCFKCIVLRLRFDYKFQVVNVHFEIILQSMQQCNQPIPCSTFNHDGTNFAYAICFFLLFLESYFERNCIISLIFGY